MADLDVDYKILQPAQFLNKFLDEGIRPDERTLEASRSLAINAGALTTANGSALIRLGDTVVICGVKAELANPHLDRPDEGYIVCNMEVPPCCSPHVTREWMPRSNCLNLFDLCIVSGELCWVLYVDVVCLCADGCVQDAAVMAMSAALADTVLPAVSVQDGKPVVTLQQRRRLSIQSLPVSITYGFFNKHVLVDPTAEEEALCTGLLSLTVLSDGKIAGMSKRGKYLVPQVNFFKNVNKILIKASRDMAERDKALQFASITGATNERAKFYIESAGGNLQAALSMYYEEHSRGFASMGDVRGRDENTEDSEKFFAGGSEHSGQLIAGPPKAKKPQDLAADLFQAAKQAGARPLAEVKEKEKSSSSSFVGTGFRLGESEGPSRAIEGDATRQPLKAPLHVLYVWSNGFSIDEGPLRNGQSVEDKLFMQSVSKGEIPDELLRSANGAQVELNIEDKRNEEYVWRPPKIVAFSGAGHKLGSITPEVTSASGSGAQGKSAVSSCEPVVVEVDPSLPTTILQIRLADGTKLQSKFNHSHTVRDIYNFVNRSHTNSAVAKYVLLTAFPRKELTDMEQSLQDAQLLNAVITQRMK
ncbi:hypothetical protein EMCRGX_G031540 [Ephydatia muelleri]